MKEVVCPVKNCGLKFDSKRSLSEHLTKKHPDYKQSVTKLFPITLTSEEKEMWNKTAKEHNMNLAEYIRFLMREGIQGKEELRKLELENKYQAEMEKIESKNRKTEKELEAMKNYFIENSVKKGKKYNAKKATLWMLKEFKGFDKDLENMEEQYMGNKLMEEEWDSLTLGQQAEVRNLLSKNKIPFAAAIKKVKKRCSKDFERFFAKELTV